MKKFFGCCKLRTFIFRSMIGDFTKSLNILVLAAGTIFIFAIFYIRIELWAKETKANVSVFAHEAQLQDLQLQQALRGIPRRN